MRVSAVWVRIPPALLMDQPKYQPCLQCGDPAIAIFHMDKGCVVYPDIQEQPLCIHHVVNATPLGEMRMLRDLRIEAEQHLPIPGLNWHPEKVSYHDWWVDLGGEG